MNAKLIYIWLMGLVLALQACENSMPVFESTESEIYFDSPATVITKTFVYDGPDATEGIVYITVKSMGLVRDYERPFHVRQIATEEEEELTDARPGIHFVPFDDNTFLMPAGASVVRIPVTVLNDESLKDDRFVLRLELVPNEYFKTDMTGKEIDGIAEKNIYKDIIITNLLTEPKGWQKWNFGDWGPVKYQFMIDITGKKWDEEFFKELSANYSYMLFMKGVLIEELQLENARRAEQGLDVLREAPEAGETIGKEVKF